jgi:glycosyltransferase involved in cell wall biosynthesis
MDKGTIVSIITVTRNRANLLIRAIESVLKQTYTDFEYIIIDGASEDNTEEVIKSFSDTRIKYIKQANNIDVRLSLDHAVELARGKYLSFLDDDDEYKATKIQKQLDRIESLSDEYGYVYCWMDYFDDSKNHFIKTVSPRIRGNIFHYLLEQNSFVGTPSIFIKKAVYLECGGWNKKIEYISDLEFLTRVSRKYLVDLVPESLVIVHINHVFQRQSVIQSRKSNKVNLQKQLEFHEYYLTEFASDFNKCPQKRINHQLAMARLYAYLNQKKKSIAIIKQLINDFGIKMFFRKKIFKIFILNFIRWN